MFKLRTHRALKARSTHKFSSTKKQVSYIRRKSAKGALMTDFPFRPTTLWLQFYHKVFHLIVNTINNYTINCCSIIMPSQAYNVAYDGLKDLAEEPTIDEKLRASSALRAFPRTTADLVTPFQFYCLNKIVIGATVKNGSFLDREVGALVRSVTPSSGYTGAFQF